jgi:23S rRNA (cytosine1962-C5)-methyltransferase
MELFFNHLKQNLTNFDEAKRIFHGRGKKFAEYEFFNIDYFPPYIQIIAYRELDSILLHKTVKYLREMIGDRLQGIILQKRYLELAPFEVLVGNVPSEVQVVVEGLNYLLKFSQNQNTGFFLDMKMGREFLIKNSKNKRVLNLFSYTCVLSVVAIKNGASKVTNFDMSKGAINRGILNHKLNQIPLGMVKFFSHDIFKSFGRIKKDGPYDLIIIDPPSDHGNHFNLDRDYPKILRRIEDWSTDETILMTCLNSPHKSYAYLKSLVFENTTKFEFVESFGFPSFFEETNPDHGLKIIIWRKYGNPSS